MTTLSATPAGRSAMLLPKITAGLVLGFIEVIIALSFASLIFAGPLASELPRGVGIALVAGAIHVLIPALLSSFDGLISSIQDNSSTLLAIGVASLAGATGAGPATAETVFIFLCLTTLLTGGVLILLGRFKLGGLVRFIPYPVIGGFLAGTGWLLAQGSIGTMASYSLIPENFSRLLTGDQILLWLPGVAFGLALFFGVRRIRHTLALPGILVGGIVLFFIGLVVTGTSIETATQRGLLLGNIGGAGVWHPLPIGDLGATDWSAILGQIGNIGIIVILTAVSLLLNISGLELALMQDADINHELRVSGLSNLLAGLGGGMIGFHTLSLTSLSHRVGGKSRLSGIIMASVCLGMLILGSSLLAYVPKSLLGGLLFFLGLEFVHEWVILGRKKLSRADYLVVLAIVLIIAIWGFLVGVTVGLVLMIVLFVINYSRLNLFNRISSGVTVTSNVRRAGYYRRRLTELGKHIHVLELQSFVFFATAHTILEQIRKRLNDSTQAKLEFLVLDFARVDGLDSSAAFAFTKVIHMATANAFMVILTNLPNNAERELARNNLKESGRVLFFPDLDHGLEYCEEQLLERDTQAKSQPPSTLQLQLAISGLSREDANRLRNYLEPVEVTPGDYLIRQGDQADDIYFVESGQVSVYLELKDGNRMRLWTSNIGTVVGEVAFFQGGQRSATVVADHDTRAYRITREAMQRMRKDDEDLLISFQELMLRLMSERLIGNAQSLTALQN